MKQSEKKVALLRGIVIFVFFLLVAVTVTVLCTNFAYLFLFLGIGTIAGITEFAIAANLLYAQIIRRVSLNILAGSLFVLALIIGINFQFSQIFIDIYTGVVTGALIQFVAARLILPFFFGNIFCSRACWDGAVFESIEIEDKKITSEEKYNSSYRSVSAWIFLLLIVTVASVLGILSKITQCSGNAIRWRFIVLNIIIISVGVFLSRFKGRRAYCRKICPFLTVSGIISRFSLFKVTPVKSDACTECGKCIKACPMQINVMNYVLEKKRIDHPDCIMCEKCVSVCPSKCIMVTTGLSE